jgi:hypothetical protein
MLRGYSWVGLDSNESEQKVFDFGGFIALTPEAYVNE